MHRIINKNTIQKIMTLMIILILSNFIMSGRALAAGAADSDPGTGTGGSSTGQNTGSIKNAVEAGVSANEIKQMIKSECNVTDDEANKIYNTCYNDTTKIKIKYTYVAATGRATLNSVDASISDTTLDAIKNGSYNGNLGSQQANAGQTYDDTNLEGSDGGDIGGILFTPIASLIQGIGDAINKLLQNVIIGDKSPVFYDTGWFSNEKVLKVVEENKAVADVDTVQVVKEYIDTWTGKYGVPDIKLTPAEIFTGNVAALDANFFKTDADHENELGGNEKSIIKDLKSTVAAWYVALRNIAIVGLLSVLLYLGIRIVISSSAGDKAKYKQFFVDWVVALCLIFFLHYIMAFTMTMSETVTDVLAGETTSQGRIKQVNIQLIDKNGGQFYDGGTAIYFSSNFTGVARIKADYADSALKMGYSIMYIALTVYTVYFSFVYLKRLLMLAFFTMIAPLVALTYPIDKVKDGKAQAFNYWFKEYMFYALLQPLHLLLYTVFVSSALSIAANNLLYAIVALAFIVPAEKIVKQMFGIKGQTESSIGGFAGGAIASQAFNALKSRVGGNNKGGQGNSNVNNNRIRQAKNPNSPDGMSTIAEDAAGFKLPTNSSGTSAADAYQDSYDPIRDAERESLEEKLADGQINENELTNEQRAMLEMEQLNAQKPDTNDNEQAQMEDSEQEGDWRKKFKEHKKELSNNFKNAVKNRYERAGGAKGISKSAAKGAIKGYAKATGTITMGALGLGAGVVGGEISDTLKGASAGLATGSIVSNKGVKIAENAGNSAAGRFVGDVLHGEEGRMKEQLVKQHMRDTNARENILAKEPNIGAKELNAKLRAEAEMMYDTGIDDQATIQAAIKMEKDFLKGTENIKDDKEREKAIKHAHNRTISLAKLSQNYDKNTFNDQNKRDSAQRALQNKLARRISESVGDGMSKAEIEGRAKAEAARTMNQIERMKKLS